MIVTETHAEARLRVDICQVGSPMQSRDLLFAYDSARPYEIAVTIGGGVLPVSEMLISRGVLHSGRYKYVRPAGGDVSAFPDRFDARWTHVGVVAPCGSATLRMRTVDVSDFLDATYDVVGAGLEAEHLAVPDAAAYDRFLFELGDAA